MYKVFEYYKDCLEKYLKEKGGFILLFVLISHKFISCFYFFIDFAFYYIMKNI